MKQDKIKELEEKIKMLEEENTLLSKQKTELEDEILEIKRTRNIPMLTKKDKQKLQERYWRAKHWRELEEGSQE